GSRTTLALGSSFIGSGFKDKKKETDPVQVAAQIFALCTPNESKRTISHLPAMPPSASGRRPADRRSGWCVGASSRKRSVFAAHNFRVFHQRTSRLENQNFGRFANLLSVSALRIPPLREHSPAWAKG
ncbi:MAG: hypothetical protein MR450_11040, partial [Prevotella sp.]|nr:hypothetical protein [Prevotella sp.]